MLSFAPIRPGQQMMILLMILVFSSSACNRGQEAPETQAGLDTSAATVDDAKSDTTKLNCGNKAVPPDSPVTPGGKFKVKVVGGDSANVDMRTNELVADKRRATVEEGQTESFSIDANAQGQDTLNFVMYGCADDESAADTAHVAGPPTMYVD